MHAMRVIFKWYEYLGEVLLAFSEPVGMGDAIRVEALALVEVLRKAYSMSLFHVMIDVDSTTIIGWVLNKMLGSW